MGPIAAIFTKPNGHREYGLLGIDWSPDVGQLIFRTRRADAFGPDELRGGEVLIYSDPNAPPTEAVRVLVEAAERQGVRVTRNLFS
jgi:hypothetical protein